MSTPDPLKHPDKLLKAFEYASEISEKEDQFNTEIKQVLLRFLEVNDAADSLLKEISNYTDIEDKCPVDIVKRVELLTRQIELAFSRSGVKVIESVGKEVDPTIHKVVAVEKGSNHEQNIIIRETVKGYSFRDNLLRRPEVVIATDTES